MCARYSLSTPQMEIVKAYKALLEAEYNPNYNIAPTQNALIITADQPNIIQKMHFGLIPYWAPDTKLNISTLNARSEDVLEKRTYAPLLNHNKTCLVLADGFYEWDRKTGKPLPWRFIVKDKPVFAFAGLWSQWKNQSGTEVYRSFTIMTTASNDIVGKVHDPKFRMPVILDDVSEKLWLSADLSAASKLDICLPFEDEKMDAFRVSTDINSTVVKGIVNNKPELIQSLNSQ